MRTQWRRRIREIAGRPPRHSADTSLMTAILTLSAGALLTVTTGLWIMLELEQFGTAVGGIIVMVAGYVLVGRHRRLILDEILAGIALLIWIAVELVNDSLFGGANPDLLKLWGVRAGLLAVLIVAYVFARSQWHQEHAEQEKV